MAARFGKMRKLFRKRRSFRQGVVGRVPKPKSGVGSSVHRKEAKPMFPSIAMRHQQIQLFGSYPAVGAVLAAILVLVSCPGCTTFFGKNRSPIENVDMTPIQKDGYTIGNYGVMKPLPTGDESPSVVLEVNHGKRSFEKVPLVPGQPMFIADLLRDAEFNRKIGRVQVSILRPNGEKAPVRLEVDFDPTGKRVKDGMNYSLRPGDHVVVRADERSVVTQLLSGSVFGKMIK
jgi:hypothetical protein